MKPAPGAAARETDGKEDSMLESILRILMVLLTCLPAAVVGAYVGCAEALHWPLSEANVWYSVRWGIVIGLIVSTVAVGVAVHVPRRRLALVGFAGIICAGFGSYVPILLYTAAIAAA
jgi:hypothetical protein